MMRYVLVFFALHLVLCCPLSIAAVINVPQDIGTIQHGIDRASDGDTVLVDAGTYQGSVDFRGKDISLVSRNGPLSTVITGEDDSVLVAFRNGESRAALIEGFTIRGGWIGIYCENSSPTIRHNVLLDQRTDNWAAICLAGPGYPQRLLRSGGGIHRTQYNSAVRQWWHLVVLHRTAGSISQYHSLVQGLRHPLSG